MEPGWATSLIPEREGMPPLYQQQPKEVTITFAILKHQHHNNGYNVDTKNYNNNVKNTVSSTHTQERSVSSPYSNRSGIQYHQLSKILYFKQSISAQSF